MTDKVIWKASTLRLPEELHAAVIERAKRDNEDIAVVIRRALREWLRDTP